MHPFLETAIRAASAGGEVLLLYFNKDFRIEYKGELNLVTEADREAEKSILDVIRRDFPEHGILAEEGGDQSAGSSVEAPYKWIIDPLDGTTNFVHSFPAFCVSIALEKDGEIVLGVVFDPLHQELFIGQKNKGATLNKRPIGVSNTKILDRALLVTGFAYNIRQVAANNLDHFSAFTLQARGIRRTGSAALDLCYVASGRLDGFWELFLAPWDTAAGSIIATEAGATITDFKNQSFGIYEKEIVASNGHIHREMIGVLNKKMRDD